MGMQINFEHVAGVIVIGLLTWGGAQLYQMNANMSVVTYKVEENYKMIKPMWQDFLVRQANYNEYGQNSNAVPNYQISREAD